MATPNIVTFSEYYAGIGFVKPTVVNTGALLVSNLAASNSVIRINSILATNNSSTTNAAATLYINTKANGTGNSYNLAYKIVVPFNSSLQLVEKGTGMYLIEDMSIYAACDVSSGIDFIINYETLK